VAACTGVSMADPEGVMEIGAMVVVGVGVAGHVRMGGGT